MLAALRLKLLPFMPQGSTYAFVCNREDAEAILVWAWTIDRSLPASELKVQWPEPLLDEPGTGLRLVARDQGFEAQHWLSGRLSQSRWWPNMPSPEDWERFARGAGTSAEENPLPVATRPPKRTRPDLGWLRADTLPAVDPWTGWQWQALGLMTGAALSAALGIHLQTRHQLELDRALAATLKLERQAALTERTRYLQLRAEYEELRALVPTISQLELLDRILATGVLTPPPPKQDTSNAAATTALPGSIAAPAPGTTTVAPPAPSLAEWNYRNGQLKLSLDMPEGELAMLDTTRRIERMPGFKDVRIGLESSSTNLSLTMHIADTNDAGAKR